MKKYIWTIGCLLLIVLWACDPDKEEDQGKKMNTMRVKSVSGHNEIWGDFTFTCGYLKDKLDTAGVYSPAGKRVGYINAAYDADKVRMYVSQMIPAVSNEVASGLDPDSIPMRSVSVYVAECMVKNERVKSASYFYYGPVEFEEEGEFGQEYELKRKRNYVFEYDVAGKIVKWRAPGSYEFNDPVYKGEMEYDGHRLMECINYLYGVSGWEEISKDTYSWSGDLLMKMTGYDGTGEYERTYSYEGSVLSHVISTENGVTKRMSYVFNNEGLVTKIEGENGNYMQITYETGSGNFSLLTPLLEQISGIPYIQ